MKFNPTSFDGVYTIDLDLLQDERGWFARIFDNAEFKKINFYGEWLQLNHSFTNKTGTVRGMHYQIPPFAEVKLVRCIAGSVYDVIIDLRKNSVTFLQWFGIELSEKNKKMIYIPEGFAHGFQTLTDNCELIYHHSQFYKSGFEEGIKYDDPLPDIQWPVKVTTISKRDDGHNYLDKNFEGIKI